MRKAVIGLVGEASSGKGVAAQVFQDRGFEYYSLSDSIRFLATKLGMSHERDTMNLIGGSLRERFGNDILARGAQNWIKQQENNFLVVDSIRNPEEVRLLQREENAFIVGITIQPETRFELMQKRNRPGDPQTWEEFYQLYLQERGVGQEKSGIQIQECLSLCNKIVTNDGSREDFQRKIDEVAFVRRISVEGQRYYKEGY